MTQIGGTNVPPQYVSYVNQAAAATGLPAAVVAAQINEESGFQPGVNSGAGAEGIAQFLPSTFAAYGKGSPYNVADAFAAYSNYMSALLKQEGGSIQKALAAYNAGPGNIGAGMGYANTILSAAKVSSGAQAGTSRSGGTIQGIQGNVPGVSPAGFVGSAAITPGGQTTTPATPSSTGLPSLLSGAEGLLRDVATALDYFFGMFGRGQGWRLVFTVASGVSLILSYKILAAAGVVPGVSVPKAVPL